MVKKILYSGSSRWRINLRSNKWSFICEGVHEENRMVHSTKTYSLQTVGQFSFRLLLSLICSSLGLVEWPFPNRLRSVPEAKFPLHLFYILVPPLFPVHGDEASSRAAAFYRPWRVLLEQPFAFLGCRTQMSKCCCKACHGQTQVRELEEFHRELRQAVNGQIHDTVIEVVAFAISLENIRELRIVNIMDLAVVHSSSIPMRQKEPTTASDRGRTGSRVSGVTLHRSSQVT